MKKGKNEHSAGDVRLKVSRRLKELRLRSGYTQEKLSEVANIDYKYYQKIEGKAPPDLRIETIEKLTRAFEISLRQFFDF